MGVEDCVRLKEISLSYYVQNSSERLLVSVKTEGVLGSGEFQTPRKSTTETTKNALKVGRVNPFTVKSYGKRRM